MHLADARAAAVEFLEPNADLLTGDSRASLQTAVSLYQQEADALAAFAEANAAFLTWWGGQSGAADWDASTRQAQIGLLEQCETLEGQALSALADVLPTP